jgi:hypothetical protein
LVLFLIPLQFVHLFRNQSTCILLFFSCKLLNVYAALWFRKYIFKSSEYGTENCLVWSWIFVFSLNKIVWALYVLYIAQPITLNWFDDNVASTVNRLRCGQSEVLMPVGVRDFRAVPWLRWSVAGLSSRRHVFNHSPLHVGFVVSKVALRQIVFPVLRFSLVSIIPSVFHANLFVSYRLFIISTLNSISK